MRRHLLALTVLTALLGAPAAVADPVTEVGDRFARKAVEQTAATCRRDAGRDECAALLGAPDASAAAVVAHEASSTARALAVQRSLGDALPLQGGGTWIGTHNSANSTSASPTLSQSDSNQQLSLTDQLRLDVRSLELDAHWFPSLAAGGQGPVLCHAQGAPAHAGCSTERPLADGLAEVHAWLDAHSQEVLLLYLEDHLEGQAGHDAAAADVRAAFGDRLYAPPAGQRCTSLPLDLSRDQVRASGAQVVVMTGSCRTGVGTAWHGVAFAADRREESRPVGYGDHPRCGGVDLAREGAVFRRYFEDSTLVNAVTALAGAATPDDGIPPPTAAAMTRCGVDLLGLDQLVPGDGRLPALVWSFADGEVDAPAGEVAVQRAADGRWVSLPDAALPQACALPDGGWAVTAATPPAAAAGACARAGGAPGVPRTGLQAQRLLTAQRVAGADAVRLALESTGAGWR